MYNGKTDLLLTYHWGGVCCDEATVIKAKAYDTYDEAEAEMKRIMPDDYGLDDGGVVGTWEDEGLFENSEPFAQYCASLQDKENGAYVLATLTMIKD